MTEYINKGPLLRKNECLESNDEKISWLTSANDIFETAICGEGHFEIHRVTIQPHGPITIWSTGTKKGAKCVCLHDNGNLCMYKTPWPDSNYNTWCTNKVSETGSCCAYLHDDGNLCVYASEFPDPAYTIWCTNKTDPVVDIPEIYSLEYDVQAAKILQSGPMDLYRQTVVNSSDYPQTSSISGSSSVTETSGWSDAVSTKVGVSTTFKSGVPVVAEGSVTVSMDVTKSYTWNGSNSRIKTWTFDTPVSVPPHKTVVCLVSASISTISVPFTLKGAAIVKSGNRCPITVHGTYLGTNSHDLHVTFIGQGLINS